MPLTETVTIINKSGKVISTGKHLVNIFKDAKEAYSDKKAALKAEQYARIRAKAAQKLIQAREDTQSVASSRHSRSSHRSHRHRHIDREGRDAVSRPPLTEYALSQISEESAATLRQGRSSHHGSRRAHSPVDSQGEHEASYYENPDIETPPELIRRHTDLPYSTPYYSYDPNTTALSDLPEPPEYALHRSSSVPDLHAYDEQIDMNLAYGSPPPDLHPPITAEEEHELAATMSKLDTMLLEAQCLHHSATTIIANLQANPEAMAAVALTLAELSNMLTKMSPSILRTIAASSPAIFALLASPQFLIAGGVALGVTVVMFGGYKIIKQIQANAEVKKEPQAYRMEEVLVYEGDDLSSIDVWRRGIADVEAQSVATSVDGEFITPEAARQKKERIRERAREERGSESGSVEGGVRSQRTGRTVRRVGSESTIQRNDVPVRSSSSKVAASESGHSRRSGRSERSSRKEGKGKEIVVKEKKSKKSSALALIFKKSKEKKERERESTLSLRPKRIEM